MQYLNDASIEKLPRKLPCDYGKAVNSKTNKCRAIKIGFTKF